jgi:hypothetical protein
MVLYHVFITENVPNVVYHPCYVAIDIKENTAIVSFSELFTGSKNVIKLTKDNAHVGTRKHQT